LNTDTDTGTGTRTDGDIGTDTDTGTATLILNSGDTCSFLRIRNIARLNIGIRTVMCCFHLSSTCYTRLSSLLCSDAVCVA
jgi:hypothetical protein